MAKFVCNVISYTLGRTVDITVVIPTPTFPDSLGMTGVTPKHTPLGAVSGSVSAARVLGRALLVRLGASFPGRRRPARE